MEKAAKKMLTAFLIGLSALVVTAGITTAFILTTPKLDETVTIMKDGVKVNNLSVDDIQILPGESSEYEITLLSRLQDSYKVSINFEGTTNALISHITANIITEQYTYSSNLEEILNKGYQHIGTSYIDDQKGVKFTVKYEFDDQITPEMVVPFDLTLDFKISR